MQFWLILIQSNLNSFESSKNQFNAIESIPTEWLPINSINPINPIKGRQFGLIIRLETKSCRILPLTYGMKYDMT